MEARADIPTAREFGRAEREIAELKHAIRNLRMVAEGAEERLRDLEMGVARLQTRIWTAVAIIGVLAQIIAWIAR